MSHLTAKQAWYQRNRVQVIEKARQWRLEHPERYRELQRIAKRRRRKELSPKKGVETAPITTKWWETAANVPQCAPEGWTPDCGFTKDEFCIMRGWSTDPKDW